MYLHARLSFLETLKERHKSMSEEAKFDSTYDSFGLSYQPYSPTVCIDNEMQKTIRTVWYNNGATMIPLYLTVSHRANDAGLEFNFEYRREQQAAYDLTVFYSKMERIFDLATQTPDITIGELLKEIEITAEERNGKPSCKHSKNLSQSLKTTWKLTKSRLKTILSLISA